MGGRRPVMLTRQPNVHRNAHALKTPPAITPMTKKNSTGASTKCTKRLTRNGGGYEADPAFSTSGLHARSHLTVDNERSQKVPRCQRNVPESASPNKEWTTPPIRYTVISSQVCLADLVQTTVGKWITHPPSRCPIGHRLGPGEVLVGHQACLGHGGGHTTWTCRTCDQTVYGPPLNTAWLFCSPS